MCGIVGFIESTQRSGGVKLREIVQRMTDSLVHRGPDDEGIWIDEQSGVALGHRRLSIIDLSNLGHQPMISICERYVLVFNGEIYNYESLKAELEKLGYEFRGTSDTEVLLTSISCWGVEATLERLNGMFAFSVWDRKEGCLYLARDRIGEKPLYYGYVDGLFLFASELKAFRQNPRFKAEINHDVLALFMRHSYVPSPYCIYKNIYKLPAAHYCVVRTGGSSFREKVICYWDLKSVSENSQQESAIGSDDEVTAQLHTLLQDAVKLRMVSDVPLGAFLSGGIDSSLIVSLMQAASTNPIKTFSIGFHDSIYNEANHAKAVSSHLGTDHTELYLTPQDAMDVIPLVPALYDEPFADSSQIPTYLVSKLAREHVTVSLSGDGGDELFGGYDRYLFISDVWSKLENTPRWMWSLISKLITSLSPDVWDRVYKLFSAISPNTFRLAKPGIKFHRVADVLSSLQSEDVYVSLMSFWRNPDSVVLNSNEPSSLLTINENWPQLSDRLQQLMCVDILTYLPDDILTKVDRASMGVSLETRVPFIDHRVVEFAVKLPLNMKIRQNETKWIARRILSQYLNREMIDRPKMGFAVPVGVWMRGPLREWAESLLSANRLREDGIFNVGAIRQKWDEHMSGKRNWQDQLWSVLMFQAWHDTV